MASFHNIKLLCTLLISSSFVVAVLYISPYPLPWFDSGLVFDPLLRFAAAISLWGSILFYGTYLFYIHQRKFKLLQQLESAENSLFEQKKITELGLMAAACAHELGTPLGTILLVAKEMESQLVGSLRDDVDLITSQTKRCQVILKSLGSLYKSSSYFQVDLVQFIISIFHTYPHTCSFYVKNNLSTAYLIDGGSELSLAFGNIFQNAIRYAKTAVTVSFREEKHGVVISIHDDGKGFDAGLLSYLGNILPQDIADSKHMQTNTLGLGLFITKRLFEQKNVLLTFSNDHGAVYYIHIPYALLEKNILSLTQNNEKRSA
ncbi:MAG: hypothetical protein K2X98_05680 [Alphaproteobacteria bacterium]|nr:hypothetical protein [Alphaproteobacteria bacterium]